MLAVLTFFNTFFNGFSGDDYSQIVDNPLVHSIANIPSFFTGSTFNNGGSNRLIGAYYKPVTTTVLALIYSVFGQSGVAFHTLQLVIYLFDVYLFYLLLTHFFSRKPSFILTLLFLVHPFNSEVVYYISSMQEVLFYLFGLLSLLWLTKNNRKGGDLIFVALFIFIALLSKETAILFIPLALVYTWLFRRDKEEVGPLIVLFTIVILVYALLRLTAVGFTNGGIINAPIAKLTFTQKLVNVPKVTAFYLETFLLPVNLSSSYYWVVAKADFTQFFSPLFRVILYVSLLIWGGYAVSRNRLALKKYLFFTAWLVLGIALHLPIVPLDATAADRWFLFPMGGLLGLAGVLAGSLLPRLRISRKISTVFVVIVISLFSCRTILRGFDWRDDFTLSFHDAKVVRDGFDLENSLSYYYYHQDNLKEAELHARKSITIFPNFLNLNSLALVYLKRGENDRAAELFMKALKYGDYYVTYENLAGLKMAYGDPVEAEQFIALALTKFPANAKLWLYYSIVEYKLNHIQEAKSAINRAYALDPNGEAAYVYNQLNNNLPLQLNYTVK